MVAVPQAAAVQPAVHRRRVSRVLYQLSSTLNRNKYPHVEDRFREARRLIVTWMERRLKKEFGSGYRLPQPAWEGEAFELDRDGQFFGAAPVEALGLWTARVQHGDERVPTRTV